MIKTKKVTIHRRAFNEIFYPFLLDNTRLQIFYGGASSGKSTFVAQRVIHDLLAGGRNYLIIRNVARTIRTSVFNELKKVIESNNLKPAFWINKSDATITCINGYQAVMQGLDDVDKLKSATPAQGVFTDIWGEEMTEATEEDYRQLVRRLRGHSKVPKRITLTFNPILRTHWIFKRWFTDVDPNKKITKRDNLLIVKTTYKDNKFLDESEVQELENETDEYWYNVYTLGNWGVLGDVIFKNWRVEDLSGQKFEVYRNGLDFGFNPNPTALVRMGYDRKRKRIYILDELYETDLTNPAIAEKIKPIIHHERVLCDNEPKSIRELQINGINAAPAIKGPVEFGIRWLLEHEIIVDKRCQNMINELSMYHRKKDRYGNSLPEPVKKDDHLIDAMRYGLSEEMEGPNIIEFESTRRRRVSAGL